MVSLAMSGVTVHKGAVETLVDLDLVVDTGTVLALTGPSGSGKTSVLRAIAGLDIPSGGTVKFDGVDVTSRQAAERNVAMVFQDPALYPHKDVRGNIAFPLEMRRETAEEIRRRVGAEARVLHIETLLDTTPRRLSAGERRVVQVARAMVRKPALLLLDEPFANLDADLAADLRREVMLIQRGFGVTTVIATNESIDAMTMADRVAVVEDGRVTQVGRPLDVYDEPATIAAALATGEAAALDVTVEPDADGSWLVHRGFRVRAWQPGLRRYARRQVQMVVRPEWWRFDEHGSVDAEIERVHGWGVSPNLWCRVGGALITARPAGSPPVGLAAGDRLRLRIDKYVLVDPAAGRRLDLG